MGKCTKCTNGSILNPEWDREWDRYDQNSPSHWHTNKHMENSGIEKHITCPVCNGTGINKE